MEKAGIERLDDMGRKLDFHALRYTFATKLAASGVSRRMSQELLRHSDPA
jgi:site-specific recombinase XerD